MRRRPSASAASQPRSPSWKRNSLDAERMDLSTYSGVENERHISVMAHDDAKEAFQAFVEKRPPGFGVRETRRMSDSSGISGASDVENLRL